MAKKLQILIPQYHETEETVKPLLDSLAIQQNVDFNDIGVIICSDGGEVKLDESFLQSYPFDVEYHICEHNGVSATRQACLDYATAEYVMFCDADDMFYNACGLWILFQAMEEADPTDPSKKGFDTLMSVFIEESRLPDGRITYVNHNTDSTFVHGKVHRRQYLIDKNIKWNPSLRVHEDSYFNCLVQCCLDVVPGPNGQPMTLRGKYCQTPFYLWKWRDESVCRHDPKYLLKTYNNMLDSNTALVNELLQRGMRDKAQFYCVHMVFDAYYSMNTEQWINQDNQVYRRATEERFGQYYEQFRTLFEEAPAMLRNQVAANVRNQKVMEGMNMEALTFDQWLSEVVGG